MDGYTVGKQIGEGSFGHVFFAETKGSGEKVHTIAGVEND
jgi:serine/threonine protein kinase